MKFMTIAFLLWSSVSCYACAVVPPRNKPVEIADESAIIIWDAKTKTQHFIRRASFNTDARDFGFLVPTPTQPALEAAGDAAFDVLAKITAPRIVEQKAPSAPSCGCGAAALKSTAPGAADEVVVLDSKRIGDLEAKVLESKNATAVIDWLNERGYDISPSLTAWLQQYLDMQWKITAFKIAKDVAAEKRVSTSAVRMTFATEVPLFPYREPIDQFPELAKDPGKRLLRVFFIGEKKMTATLGQGGTTWPGKAVWANTIADKDRTTILEGLKMPLGSTPTSWYLTEFEDASSPRPGKEDAFFVVADDQKPVEREPHVRYVSAGNPPCVLCCVYAGFLGVSCLIRWRRRFYRM